VKPVIGVKRCLSVSSGKKGGISSFFDGSLIEKAVGARKCEISRFEPECYFIPEAHITEKARERRDKIWGMVKSNFICEPGIYEKKARARLLKELSEKCGVSEKNLYRYLHAFWECEKSSNAFLPKWTHGASEGGARRGPKPTVSRRSLNSTEMTHES
jgi:hypothetical protein